MTIGLGRTAAAALLMAASSMGLVRDANASLFTYSRSNTEAGWPQVVGGGEVNQFGTTSAASQSEVQSETMITTPEGGTLGIIHRASAQGIATATNSGDLKGFNVTSTGGNAVANTSTYAQLQVVGSISAAPLEREVSFWLNYNGLLTASGLGSAYVELLLRVNCLTGCLGGGNILVSQSIDPTVQSAKFLSSSPGCNGSSLCSSIFLTPNSAATFDITAYLFTLAGSTSSGYCVSNPALCVTTTADGAANFEHTASLNLGSAETFDITFDDPDFHPSVTRTGTNDVPEPSAIALVGMALLSLLGFGLVRRRVIA